MDNKFDKSFFQDLDAKGYIFDFVMSFSRFMEKNGQMRGENKFSYIETQRLKYVCQAPGITLKEHRIYWNKKKNTMSELITSLEKKGMVYRERNEDNHREYFIFPTETGRMTNVLNTENLAEGVKYLIDYWNKKYTTEEYYDFLDKINYLTVMFKELGNDRE